MARNNLSVTPEVRVRLDTSERELPAAIWLHKPNSHLGRQWGHLCQGCHHTQAAPCLAFLARGPCDVEVLLCLISPLGSVEPPPCHRKKLWTAALRAGNPPLGKPESLPGAESPAEVCRY